MNTYLAIFVLLVVALLVVGWMDSGDRVNISAFFSPVGCRGIATAPGNDYIFESRPIFAFIHDLGNTGFCWFIINGDDYRYCDVLIPWADPTAQCFYGPVPEQAAGAAVSVVKEYRLPIIFK